MLKASTLKSAIILSIALSVPIGACKDKSAASAEPVIITTPVKAAVAEVYPPVWQALQCLAETGPIISQHRGRSKKLGHPDNSMIGLKALRTNGYIMAEIDVAGLKDGTQILFHDGVWDEGSTGRGVVASSDTAYAQSLLLKNSRGDLSSERPATLKQVLDWADQRIYFEIDFKSSAKTDTVIQDIYDTGMQDHVILIVYNKNDVKKFKGTGMMVAAPVKKMSDIRDYEKMGVPRRAILAWTGTKAYDAKLIDKLRKANVLTAYGMMSPKYAKDLDYSGAAVLVSDYPDEAKSKTDVTLSDVARLKSCGLN